MDIVRFPHPALRRKSRPLRRVDAELRRMIANMFELMYQAEGVGLAANQVALPYRLFVMNPTGDPAQADQEHVFINPVLSKAKGSTEAEEGCLSLPGLYAKVRRPERIHITGYNLAGEEIDMDAEGFFARILQHETDHLDGVLFIDHLSPTEFADAKPRVDEFVAQFLGHQERGETPSDTELVAQLELLERERT